VKTIFLAALIGLTSRLSAAGLATDFVDVLVLDVPLGESRRVEDKTGRSLVLRNTGNEPLRVDVHALIPGADELRGPVEPILDESWVRVEPPIMTIPAQSTAACDVVIRMPKDKKFTGRTYQAMIWARSAPLFGNGISVSAGLKSRLRFQVRRR
jgi:hypothetical protein